MYQCMTCRPIKYFKKSYMLHKHQDTHSAETPWKCRNCQKEFACEYEFHVHAQSYTWKKHVCRECFRPYRTAEILRIHFNKEHSTTRINCLHCKKTFETEKTLKVRMALE